jgi:hypothetical protein
MRDESGIYYRGDWETKVMQTFQQKDGSFFSTRPVEKESSPWRESH